MKVMAWPGFSHQSKNPYGSLLYGAIQKQGVEVVEFNGLSSQKQKVDILHIHWPDHALADPSLRKAVAYSVRCLLVLWRARAKGGRVVWTAHNLQSHENLHPRLEAVFWRLLAWQLDGVISLSEAALDQVQRKIAPRKIPMATIPHGHYREAYLNNVDRPEARRKLGIASDTFVVGWVGQIRAYKGLQELIGAWRKSPTVGKMLLIAGQAAEPSQLQFLERSAREDATIQFHNGRVEDSELQVYLNASDVLIMPYRKILNSGSALLGLSFNRPIALPRTVAMEELQKQVDADWVYLYDGDFDETILAKILEWTAVRARPAVAPLAYLEWDRIAEKTIAFFQQVIAQGKS